MKFQLFSKDSAILTLSLIQAAAFVLVCIAAFDFKTPVWLLNLGIIIQLIAFTVSATIQIVFPKR